MKKYWQLIVLTACIVIVAASPSAHAMQMCSFDLDSLMYASTSVVEGEIVAAQESSKETNWVDLLTVKVTKSVVGDVKADEKIVVALSPYRRVKHGVDGRFGVGDTVILFLTPIEKKRQEEYRADYWPVPSGVKVVDEGNVTGMLQGNNPGPYVNYIVEGKIDAYREKMSASLKWVVTFKKDFAEKKGNVAWLLAALAARPDLADGWHRDLLALDLCRAIAATHDADAIVKAKALRKNYHEQQTLGR